LPAVALALALSSPAAGAGACPATWPSYWQDPAFAKTTMWEGQLPSDTPASQNWKPSNPQYTNPPFRLSDNYTHARPDAPSAQTWRDPKFDPLFDPKTPQDQKRMLAEEYGWEVMHYIQAGNIGHRDLNYDWELCNNKVRRWYNMPFQTFDVLQGREFIHGLTREAPVTFSVQPPPGSADSSLPTTVWAVGFYNGNGARTIGKVWLANGTVKIPLKNLAFPEGTVIGKLLFTTAGPSQLPFLKNVPQWTANISTGSATNKNNPTYCVTPSGADQPTQSTICPRSPASVTLLQFDIAVRDRRAPNGWVFGTFVADGEAKANEANPWDRISLLGLIWGNDTPPMGILASQFPVDPKANGFKEGVIAWDVAARLNQAGGPIVSAQPGHLGCDTRLNGPADNVSSSCLSCHMTASVPDSENRTPPILAQFGANTDGSPLTSQCHLPGNPNDKEYNGVSFAQMDSIYFATTKCGTPFNTKLPGGQCVLGSDIPNYADHNPSWVATDFSLQMSGALVEWLQWQADLSSDKAFVRAESKKHGLAAALKEKEPDHVFKATIPERGE
jgi:hypothetical protein